jgi:hypothetical protein
LTPGQFTSLGRVFATAFDRDGVRLNVGVNGFTGRRIGRGADARIYSLWVQYPKSCSGLVQGLRGEVVVVSRWAYALLLAAAGAG